MQDMIRKAPKMMTPVDNLANKGDYNALFDWAYDNDKDTTEKNILKEVRRAYEILMDNGYAMAANNLGSMYYNGRGVKRDLNKAIEYYEISCEMGEQMAYSNLGYCYYYGGEDVEIDYRKSYEIFSEGVALTNDINCLYKLGDHYRYGHYVKENHNKAFHLYMKALNSANLDYERDVECLGDIHYRIGDYLLHGYAGQMDILEGYRHLNIALNILYGRYDRDKYVKGTIKKCKKLVKEAEKILEGRIVDEEIA